MKIHHSFIALTAVLAAISVSALRADDTEPGHVRPISTAPATTAPTSSVTVSPGMVNATPEMWFYEQSMRRYDDPKTAVRAAAEFRSAQRRARLAATQWYGYSNSRPASGIDPVDGYTQFQWIGNGYNPNTWIAPSNSTWMMPQGN
jgi:hypothetical protein